MKLTGERVIPEQFHYDVRDLQAHISRYVWAMEFCQGKEVLDCACGVGYGTMLLSWAADHAHGIDIDAESIQYAWEHYKTPHNGFQQLSVYEINRVLQLFEVVVSFETIEHLDKPGLFVAQVYEVLATNGLFICSAPEKSGSEWHVQDYTKDELRDMLSRSFDPAKMRYFTQGPRTEIREQEEPLWPDHPTHLFICQKEG